jgi:hypothetical protein
MTATTPAPLEYYAAPGWMTDVRQHAALLQSLPGDIPALCRVVQGNLLHVFWAERYGVLLSDERKQEVNIRRASTMLARIQAVDDRSLTVPRPPEKRLVGNCRDFSVLCCALLRYQGIPARPRCGFGTYFEKNEYTDHWICEYWNAEQGHWIGVDAQIDEKQSKTLAITFDPQDVPDDRFWRGGKAWQACRAGKADPKTFGIFDMHGLWFIRGNLLRDMAALNKMELLPWDGWGLIEYDDQALSADDLALLDHVAALTLADDSAFNDVRTLYENEPRLKVPAMITTFRQEGPFQENILDDEMV